MISLLVTFAVKAEARPFERLIGTHPDLQVLLTHIGQRNAEKAICQELVERTPKMVLTCGFAGGLNPELTIGTVVFSVDANQLDTVSPPPTSPRQERSRPYGEFPSREGAGVGSAAQKFAIQPEVLSAALLVAGARPARFQCVEKVVTTAKAKSALREQTGADAVEMESGIIRAVCGRRNIPSATVRVISDAA